VEVDQDIENAEQLICGEVRKPLVRRRRVVAVASGNPDQLSLRRLVDQGWPSW